MPKRRRTPQEKKRLSYAKDRRRIRTSSNKAPRKIVPRRRAFGHRAARRATNIPLQMVSDERALELAEDRFGLKTRARWRKWNDRPLTEHIDEQTWRRTIGREGRKQDSKLRNLLWELERAERDGFCGVHYRKGFHLPTGQRLREAGLTVTQHPRMPNRVVVARLR